MDDHFAHEHDVGARHRVFLLRRRRGRLAQGRHADRLSRLEAQRGLGAAAIDPDLAGAQQLLQPSMRDAGEMTVKPAVEPDVARPWSRMVCTLVSAPRASSTTRRTTRRRRAASKRRVASIPILTALDEQNDIGGEGREGGEAAEHPTNRKAHRLGGDQACAIGASNARRLSSPGR
jgi:hypothetical protein